MNRPISKKSHVSPTSSMMRWDGPNIPCLNLCEGDNINNVVYEIATKVCKLVDDYQDLATLDYSCIIDLCNNNACADLSNPEKVSIKGIMQVLLNNDCKLIELIESVQSNIDQVQNNNLVFELDLKCLEPALISICKSTTNYSLNDLLQAMINVICMNNTTLTTLINNSEALTIQTENLVEAVENNTYEEPMVSSPCINDGVALLHSQFTVEVANAICDLLGLIGTSGEVATALSANLTSNLNNNLAQNEYNQWQFIQSLIDRITVLENGCCKHSCEDISLGFETVYNNVDDTYTTYFNYGTGTNIPPYFNDCGSTITISDEDGVSVTSPINITNSTVLTLAHTALSPSMAKTITVNSCLTDGNITCTQNITIEIPGYGG